MPIVEIAMIGDEAQHAFAIFLDQMLGKADELHIIVIDVLGG